MALSPRQLLSAFAMNLTPGIELLRGATALLGWRSDDATAWNAPAGAAPHPRGRTSPTGEPIADLAIIFHGIGPAPAYVPKAERPYWMAEKDFAAFAVAASAKAREFGVTPVATFDDGNRTDRFIAALLLKRYGIRGIFFPCAGRIGRLGYLSADDVRALDREGFEIGSHGMNHVPWTGVDDKTLEGEIAGSKAVLQDILGHEIRSAALPFGAYNRRVLASLRTAGYTTVYSSDPGISQADQWFRRRWCYRADRSFDVGQLAAISKTVRHEFVAASRNFVKSLR
jgi:peptidoglycan/xylan/chitin deacetylase (PgdA/CDA1 family)